MNPITLIAITAFRTGSGRQTRGAGAGVRGCPGLGRQGRVRGYAGGHPPRQPVAAQRRPRAAEGGGIPQAVTFDGCSSRPKRCRGKRMRIPQDGAFPVAGKAVKSTLGSIRACQSNRKKGGGGAFAGETQNRMVARNRSRLSPPDFHAPRHFHAHPRYLWLGLAQTRLSLADRRNAAAFNPGRRPGATQLLEQRPPSHRPHVRFWHYTDRSRSAWSEQRTRTETEIRLRTMAHAGSARLA